MSQQSTATPFNWKPSGTEGTSVRQVQSDQAALQESSAFIARWNRSFLLPRHRMTTEFTIFNGFLGQLREFSQFGERGGAVLSIERSSLNRFLMSARSGSKPNATPTLVRASSMRPSRSRTTEALRRMAMS